MERKERETILLKDNSKAIRKKIFDAGIKVCICASFDKACWLDYHTKLTHTVHGVGYYDGFEFKTQKEACDRFMAEEMNIRVCKDVDEFIEAIKNCDDGNEDEQ